MFISACSNANEPVRLVEDGKTEYQIVIPDKAAPNEAKAAGILSRYMNRVSGISPAIVRESSFSGKKAVFIGKTRKAPDFNKAVLENEGFYIISEKDALFIRGGGGKGVVYGVYTFLEKYLGCRKYAGGEPVWTPEMSSVIIPAGVREIQNPKFRFRQTYYPSSEDPEYLEWHKLHRFEDLWGVWGHSYFRMISPEKHFAAHPEYFALVHGRRQATQLCLSNETVFQLAVEYLIGKMRERPDAEYWSVSPNDGTGYCTCDQCAAADAEEGGPQGSLIRFVNRIAAVFPEHQFTTLAYTYTSRPPQKTRPAANVYVLLSTIDAYRTIPLASESSATEFRRNLNAWKTVTPNIFVWDYTTQFTNFLTPFPDYNNAKSNIGFFARNKIGGVFLHGSELSYSDMAEWNSYLHARLLWQPDVDADIIREDFMKGYYGAAGIYIGRYMDEIQHAVRTTASHLDIYGNPVNDHNGYLSPERIDKYSRILDSAEAVVEEDPLKLERVQRVRLSVEYTVLQQAAFFGTERHGYLVADPQDETVYIVRPGWSERVQRFVNACKTAGVLELSEGGLTPDAYGQKWADMIASGWKKNMGQDAQVTLQYPFAPEYPAKKERTLTDGMTGGDDFSANWLLFYNTDMVVTIDLKEEMPVHRVTPGFLYDPRHYILLPDKIRVDVSSDGQHFAEAGVEVVPAPEEDFAVRQVRYTFTLKSPAPIRYIRVMASCPPALPAWRIHETKKPAIACDEVMIE